MASGARWRPATGSSAATPCFDLDDYDVTRPLVIDPVISYSTYLGGTAQSAVTALAVDASGNLYAAGWTEAIDFPVSNAIQAVNRGGVDAFVFKLNPAGSTLLYATYIGGRGDDRAAASRSIRRGRSISPVLPLPPTFRWWRRFARRWAARGTRSR